MSRETIVFVILSRIKVSAQLNPESNGNRFDVDREDEADAQEA
jgi:hypothetical protein